MRKSLIAAATLAMAASGTAFAKPVKMTDQQMDQVTAGLLTVIAVDVVDVNNNNVQVAIPVTAGVQAAVNILGASNQQQAVLPGRVDQRR